MSLASGAIGGPGVTLPPPVALYPSGLINVATLPTTQRMTLAGGQTVLLPRGQFVVALGAYCQLQWLDPVTTVWTNVSSARMAPDMTVVSDGNNFRVGNFTGCPVAGIVTQQGTIGYAQGTTTISAGTGNSQWLPIVGGVLGTTTTITAHGSGYGIAPLVFCAAPPAPGVPASFTAAITNGTVSSITCVNQGAGYTANQTLSIVPDPFDPLLLAGTTPTAAKAIATLVAATGTPTNGQLTAALCVNPGIPLSTAPTLTVTGASAGATVSAVMLWTATGLTVTTGSTISAANLVTSAGGIPSASPAFTNPATELTNYIPRQAQMAAAVSSGTLVLGNTVAAVYDGGLFTGTPNAILLASTAATGGTSLSFILGTTSDTVTIQPVA